MSNTSLPPDSDLELRQVLVKQIFVAQLILIVVTALMVPFSIYAGLGWFWFAFIAGIFGSSVAVLRRVTSGKPVTYFSKDSWALLLSPLLYGGIMAGIAYIMMGSGLVSGAQGDGLLKTNLFPSFGPQDLMNKLAQMSSFLEVRPSSLQDAAKLIVWCFLAGYSENFVTGVLSSFDNRATSMIGDRDTLNSE